MKEKLLFVMYLVVKVKLSLLTSELNGGQWSTTRPNRFTPRQRTPAFIEQTVGWTSKTFWTFWRKEKSWIPAGIRIPYLPPLSLLIIPSTPEDKQVTIFMLHKWRTDVWIGIFYVVILKIFTENPQRFRDLRIPYMKYFARNATWRSRTFWEVGRRLY